MSSRSTFGTSEYLGRVAEMRRTTEVAFDGGLITEETRDKLRGLWAAEELASEDVRIVRQLLIDFCPKSEPSIAGDALDRLDRLVARSRRPRPVPADAEVEELAERLRDALEAIYARGLRLTTSGSDMIQAMAIVRLDDVTRKVKVWP